MNFAQASHSIDNLGEWTLYPEGHQSLFYWDYSQIGQKDSQSNTTKNAQGMVVNQLLIPMNLLENLIYNVPNALKQGGMQQWIYSWEKPIFGPIKMKEQEIINLYYSPILGLYILEIIHNNQRRFLKNKDYSLALLQARSFILVQKASNTLTKIDVQYYLFEFYDSFQIFFHTDNKIIWHNEWKFA